MSLKNNYFILPSFKKSVQFGLRAYTKKGNGLRMFSTLRMVLNPLRAHLKRIRHISYQDGWLRTTFFLLSFTILLSVFLSSTLVLEEIQARTALAAGILRLIVVILPSLVLINYVYDLIARQEWDSLSTLPLPRSLFNTSCWLGHTEISIALSVMSGFCLWAISESPLINIITWMVTVSIESLCVLALALFFSMGLKSRLSAVLAVISAYSLGRIVSGISEHVFHSTDITFFHKLVLLLPHFDHLSQSSWLLSSKVDIPWMWVIHTVSFMTFILLISSRMRRAHA